MKFSWTGFIVSWLICTAAIYAYNCTYTLHPGMVAVVQHSNGEIDVVKQPGYHWSTGKVLQVKKSITMRTVK